MIAGVDDGWADEVDGSGVVVPSVDVKVSIVVLVDVVGATLLLVDVSVLLVVRLVVLELHGTH